MFYYVTAGSGEVFIKGKMQYAVRSLMNTGIPYEDIHVIVNNKQDRRIFRTIVPDIKNIYELNENLDKYRWKYMGGKRKYAVMKSAGIHKFFPKPQIDKYLVLFDGDVLWYKNPTQFLAERKDKTWFHHGKGLAKRASIKKENVDVKSLKSLTKWCRPALAYLLHYYGVDVLPDREVCSGFYILHPRDHEDLPKISYEGCRLIADKFSKDGSAGEQCPLNAALCKLKTDWHGGSRFFCPSHEEYFDHFFGDKDWKDKFNKKVKQMGL